MFYFISLKSLDDITFFFGKTRDKLGLLLATIKRCTTQTLVVKIYIRIKSLKTASSGDGSTQSVIADV